MAGLKVTGATVLRGGKAVVSDVGFIAPVGKVTGLVGPNGAGKSSLLGGVVGLHRMDAGQVHFDGVDLLAMGRKARAQLCAFVEQSAVTEERLSVFDVVALGRIPHGSAWGASLGNEDETVVAAALERVGMSAFAGRLFMTLSGGEQQRVHMARALAQEPRLLVLDEPTSHLDIRAQLQMLDLLRELADAGGTVLLALHDLNLALSRCDWVVAMHEGQMVAEGLPGDVLTEAFLAEVYGVRAHRLMGPEGPVIAYSNPL